MFLFISDFAGSGSFILRAHTVMCTRLATARKNAGVVLSSPGGPRFTKVPVTDQVAVLVAAQPLAAQLLCSSG